MLLLLRLRSDSVRVFGVAEGRGICHLGLEVLGVTAVQCAGFERMRRACAVPARSSSAKVIMEELDFCYLWIDYVENTENATGFGKPRSTLRPTGTFVELDRL